jgi:hypothetical protein
MATNTDVSSPASGTAAIFSLLTTLCAAGWIVKRWSDATTLSSDNVDLTTNPYGSASSGAGNLGNTSAWFRVAAGDASREWLFQRGSGDATWTISRSKAGFTGGSPNATTVGTATDATALFSAASAFSATPGRWFISVDTVTYGWAAYAITLGGGNVLTFLADEPLLTGSSAAEDTDPYLWLGYYNPTGLAATGAFIVNLSSTTLGYKRWVTAASNQRICYGMVFDSYAGAQAAPAIGTTGGQMGQTAIGAKEVPIPINVFRNAAAATSTGWAGITSRHRWCTVGGRANGDKLVSGADNWLYAAGLWVKWDSSTPTLS